MGVKTAYAACGIADKPEQAFMEGSNFHHAMAAKPLGAGRLMLHRPFAEAPMTTPTSPYKSNFERTDSAPPHPGEILREDVLPHFQLSFIEAAWRCGLSCAEIECLAMERCRVTPDVAVRLAAGFGLRADYWLALQNQHDLWQRIDRPGEIGHQGRTVRRENDERGNVHGRSNA